MSFDFDSSFVFHSHTIFWGFNAAVSTAPALLGPALRSANFPLFATFSGWTNSVLSGRHPRLMTAGAKSRTIARTQNLKQHPVN